MMYRYIYPHFERGMYSAACIKVYGTTCGWPRTQALSTESLGTRLHVWLNVTATWYVAKLR